MIYLCPRYCFYEELAHWISHDKAGLLDWSTVLVLKNGLEYMPYDVKPHWINQYMVVWYEQHLFYTTMIFPTKMWKLTVIYIPRLYHCNNSFESMMSLISSRFIVRLRGHCPCPLLLPNSHTHFFSLNLENFIFWLEVLIFHKFFPEIVFSGYQILFYLCTLLNLKPWIRPCWLCCIYRVWKLMKLSLFMNILHLKWKLQLGKIFPKNYSITPNC